MRTRVSDLTETILRQRSDIESLSPVGDGPDDFLDYFGGPDYFDDECIFDSVDDLTALWLLNDWLDERANVGWNAHLEISKLLAKRGYLIQARAEEIVRQLVTGKANPGQECCLSFLPWLKDGELLAIELLGIMPTDFRDGLFHACFKMNTPAIYEAVKTGVRRWTASDETWGNGTGEAHMICQMIEKWDQTFPAGDHADIRFICQRAKVE